MTKHLPANERRAITVDAVVELAAQQNPNEITTAAIAKHMGVSQGALFKHFSSKESGRDGMGCRGFVISY